MSAYLINAELYQMNDQGVLYIVATPIGNLEDMTQRAISTLKRADFIAAEDTRHSGKLLSYIGVDTKVVAYHDHSTEKQTERLLGLLEAGQSIALISDAGTPLISDPGYRIVRLARERAIQVVPIPGVSAPITALSAAGLATDRFTFEGFLPAKSSGRRKCFERLELESATTVFFESPHRISDCISDAIAVLGKDREAAMARELTKTFETFVGMTLGEIAARIASDSNQSRGEIVLMIAGVPEQKAKASDALPVDAQRVLKVLAADLPTKQAATLASQITGAPKKALYNYAIELKQDDA